MEFFKYLILTILAFVHVETNYCDRDDLKTFLKYEQHLKEFDAIENNPNDYLLDFIKKNNGFFVTCKQETQRFANQNNQKNIIFICSNKKWHLLNHKTSKDNFIEIEKVLLDYVKNEMIKCEGKP